MYNPAIGKFLSVDPIAKDYPMLTPYQFASNTPIQAIDLDGLEMVGYTKLLKEGYGDNNMVTKVLNENTVWIAYLNSTFVNMNTGENLGATVNGRFSNVSLDIEGVKADPGAPFGATRIEYRDENGNWIPLENKRNAQNAQVRVAVKINLNAAKGMEGLITISHEIILHAEEKAQWIQDYQSGNINMQELRQRYADNLLAGENNQGHRDMVLGTNQVYNAVNNATMVVLDRLYKTPSEKVLPFQYLDQYLSPLPPEDTENKYVFKIPYSIQYQAKVNLERASTSQSIGGAIRASFLQQDGNSSSRPVYEGEIKK